jgi:hypothetical protein
MKEVCVRVEIGGSLHVESRREEPRPCYRKCSGMLCINRHLPF